MNRRTMSYAMWWIGFLLVGVALAACGDDPAGDNPAGSGYAPGTGGVIAHANWPADASAPLAPATAGTLPLAAPPGVITMRATVSGSGMNNVVAEFNAAAGSGTISDVPAGIGRMLTLQGLDGGGSPIFQGDSTPFNVTAGGTTDAGQVNMVANSGVPYEIVTPVVTTINENGGTGSFTVKLNTQPDDDVVLSVGSTDSGEAEVSSVGSPTPAASLSLTFDATNWDLSQTVTVHGVRDYVQDGDQDVNISLSINTGLTLDTTGYADHTAAQVPDVSVTIVDGDTPGATVTPGTTTFSENSGAGSFSVRLNTVPDGDVAISLSSGNTNKVLVNTTSPLIFDATNWDQPQAVSLSGVDNAIDDGNAVVTIAVNPVPGATSDTTGYADLLPGDVADVNVTVVDDDTANTTVTTGTTTFSESGGTGSFDVVLNSQPTGTVVVTVTSNDTSEALVKTGAGTPGSAINLTFPTGGWNNPQTVTVVGQDDNFVDASVNVSISVEIHTGLTQDSIYDGVGAKTVWVTVTDNEAPIIYVKTTGNDSNTGTISSPKGTVRGAINYLNDLGLSGEVKVMSGTYNVTYPTSHVVLVEGIDVTGGWNSTFTTQTPGGSTIADQSTTGGNGATGPTRAVEAGSSITTATVFDGFTVIGGPTSGYSGGIYITGAPTIRRNHIAGGGSTNWSVGIWLQGDGADIYNNTIRGGAASTSAGIYFTLSTTPPSPYAGRILNNTISGGYGTGCNWGIAFTRNTAPSIENNIVFSENTSTGSCDYPVYERTASGAAYGPSSFYNNDLYGGTALYVDNTGSGYTNHTTIGTLETAMTNEGISRGNNVSLAPAFANQAGGNWHLTAGTNVGVRQGGKDWSILFGTDKDLTLRSAPWSIGAYEQP